MKRKQIVLLVFVLLLLIAGGISLYLYKRGSTPKPTTSTQPSSSQNNSSPSPAPMQATPTPVPAATLYYPMTNFDNRITVRTFGQLVKTTDVVSPCGAPFNGYHNADDLEVTAAEVNADVPVYAVVDGTVREVGPVSGYGGLLVLGVTINGQSYTVYYGHINLGSTSLVAGSAVKAGQKLAILGAQCSVQTGGERKHLHFTIHSGTTIDVRGYVPSLDVLTAWVDPKVFLAQNMAANIQ